MKILVTGGTGYVGNQLVKQLRGRGFRVFSLSRSAAEHIDDLSCDLAEIENVDYVCDRLQAENVEIVVHFAAKVANEKLAQSDIFDRNLKISQGFIRLIGMLTPSKVINASSTAVYPEICGVFDEDSIINPSVNTDALYGLSKFVAENLIQYNLKSRNIQCIHLRIGQVYGEQMPADRIIPVLRKELQVNSQMTLFGDGKRIIPFVNILFLIDVIEKFIENNAETGVYNVVSENSSLISIAHRIAQEEGVHDPHIVLVPEGKTSEFRVKTQKLNKFLNSVS